MLYIQYRGAMHNLRVIRFVCRVVTCETELFRNDIEIRSEFYFASDHARN